MTAKPGAKSRSKAKEGRARPPLHVRVTARAALFSLIIAVAALFAANLQPPGVVTATLKLVFMAAAATAGVSLILWAMCSGLHFMFGGGGNDQDPPKIY